MEKHDYQDNVKIIGPLVKKWREYNGWTQTAIARDAGIDHAQYCHFENGKTTESISLARLPAVYKSIKLQSAEELIANVASLEQPVPHEILAPAIKHVREQAGLYSKVLAYHADIPKSSYDMFEAGKRDLPGIKIEHILKELKTPDHPKGFLSRQQLLDYEKTLREGKRPVDLEELGKALKRYRFKYNLSDIDAGTITGVARPEINNLENNRLAELGIHNSKLFGMAEKLGFESPQDMIDKAKDWPEPPQNWRVPPSNKKIPLIRSENWVDYISQIDAKITR